MKKLIGLLVISLSLFSCTVESISQETVKVQKSIEPQYSTFTIMWDSNQTNPYVQLNKMHFEDCELTILSTENIRERKFEVTLQHGQPFDIQILRESTVKNPELYLAIFKGNELQFEQEVNTNGFLLSTFVDGNGNILN